MNTGFLCVCVCVCVFFNFCHRLFNFNNRALSLLSLNSFLSSLIFVAIVNGIFLKYCFRRSLLVNKNIVYLLIIFVQFPSSNKFFVESAGFSMCKIMLSAHRNTLSSLLPSWMSLIPSSCLIVLADL